METLNYQRLMTLKPTLYDTIVNQLGQRIDLYEHPTKGDSYPVIAVYDEEKLAVCTDFWDTEDFYEGSDYNLCYMHGELKSAWELDLT